MTARNARRRAILAKRYPTRDGSIGRDVRSYGALQATPGPLRPAGEPSPAEQVRAMREAAAAAELEAADLADPSGEDLAVVALQADTLEDAAALIDLQLGLPPD